MRFSSFIYFRNNLTKIMEAYKGTKSALNKNTPVKDTSITLNNGITMPIIGLGTYRIQGNKLCFNVINSALKAGYRSFDTAAGYRNESDIGEALKICLPLYNLKREDIFITSKLAPKDHGKSKVKQAVQESLNNLGVSYIDLYLIHWPGASGIEVTDVKNQILRLESWECLISLQQEGKLRAIGVSNYTNQHLNELLSYSSVPPTVNQVEFHPFFKQSQELLDLCAKHNILLQAYSSFGGSGETSLLCFQTICDASTQLNVQPGQLLLRWALQHGYAVVPKTVHEERMRENLQIDFSIPDSIMASLNDIQLRKKFAWDPAVVK